MGVHKRGRKSATHLTMIKPKPKPQALEPPKDPEEAKIFHQIVDAMPDGFFNQANAYVLRALCSHIATADMVAAELATAREGDDMAKVDLLTKIQVGESRAVADLSTKLKLTPRSRMGQEKAAVREALNSSTRPWEVKR
jgi:hypothetical protein